MADCITILGGRGMLGSDLAPALVQTGHSVRILDLPEFDLTRNDHLAHALDGAQIIVNCAAFTNVDQAEKRFDTALAVNGRAVGTLGAAAKERGAFVVHISTDFVFDGRQTRPYVETDPPNPINAYGRSKLEGERALQHSACAHVILRVQWSYGSHGANFISKIQERARTGAELKVVADQVGAPTWTLDMARVIAVLIRDRREGLYHFANSGYASRCEVARFIAAQLTLPTKITPCTSEAFPTPALRPKNSRFDTAKIQSILDAPIRSWQEALAEFLRTGPG
ncbi:MAG: dTDP-4-dehydrorhamnose reductase [Verrucomicrobia bacterium]|nr:dTDP-4-dehydrorhamnose reductase [Verrucomicrobiota bacterium]